MKRRMIVVTLTFDLEEAPDNSTLKEEGLTLQEYADVLLEDMNFGDIDKDEISKIKITTRVVEE